MNELAPLWIFFLLVLIAVALVCRDLFRTALGDKIERFFQDLF